jgi:hypothetical protein
MYLAEIRDTDYRTKTFSCCRCGADGALAITEPNTETGMTDYQLDQVEGPQHYPDAVVRLTEPPKRHHRRQHISLGHLVTERRDRAPTLVDFIDAERTATKLLQLPLSKRQT